MVTLAKDLGLLLNGFIEANSVIRFTLLESDYSLPSFLHKTEEENKDGGPIQLQYSINLCLVSI